MECNGFKFMKREEPFFEHLLEENVRHDVYKLDLRSDDTLLDIGACIGTFSIPASTKVKRVISFEPEVSNYLQLEENIAINHRENIRVYQRAVVGNNDTTRILWINRSKQYNNFGRHSFYPNKSLVSDRILTDSKVPVTVDCININSVLATFNPTVIKLDCEGSENEILLGIEDFSGIEQISFEFHFDKMLAQRLDPKATYWNLIKFLQDRGFDVFYNRKNIDKLVINQVAVAFIRCTKRV